MESQPKLPPLCEALDEKNRPLCLLDYANALEQGLRHRAFALMLRGRDGKFILRKNGDTYGFYRFTFLPAGLAGEDAAIAEIGAGLGVAESHPVFVGRIQPCPESRQGLVDIFVAEVPRREALDMETDTQNWLFLTMDELAAFCDNSLLEPFKRHALALGFFIK